MTPHPPSRRPLPGRAAARCLALSCLAAVLLPGGVRADAVEGPPVPDFAEGDVLRYHQIEKLRPFLPEEFWEHRRFFFFEGMKIEIGPFRRDYAPAAAYQAATERFRGESRIGPDGSLVGYTAGQPFPMEDIDCHGDPDAGRKIIWDFDYQWRGDGGRARFYYTYWDRGEKVPLWFKGWSKVVQLAHRVEPRYLEEQGGDVYANSNKKAAFGVEVEKPFESRGLMLTTYRYKASDGPRSESANDDAWVYVPAMRLVRRLSTAQRADAVRGTDFTFDDLFSFAGIVPQYDWTCLGKRVLMAPMNTNAKGYPYEDEHYFGPYGLSFASDRWELRDAVLVRMVPKSDEHPYSRKDIYLDEQTLVALFSFAYDRNGELWKIIWHAHRWSEDESLTGPWHGGWEGVETPSDLRYVGDIIVNVQRGTGNRIEYWDNDGVPIENPLQRRGFIDQGRLTKGR
jgi:hypothetical protein